MSEKFEAIKQFCEEKRLSLTIEGNVSDWNGDISYICHIEGNATGLEFKLSAIGQTSEYCIEKAYRLAKAIFLENGKEEAASRVAGVKNTQPKA